jgi:glucokinase
MTSRVVQPAKLVADIGGTNARFALMLDGAGKPTHERVLSCVDFDGPVPAIQHYLTLISKDLGQMSISAAALAIANPITGDWVKMTNHTWEFSTEQTRLALGLDRLILLNDFSALALSLPRIDPSELRQVGKGTPTSNAALALIGPGTGLGASGLIPSGSSWIPLQGEGGHASFSPADAYEADILHIVRRRYSHVSTERLVSGKGLPNLYAAIAELEGHGERALSAAEITNAVIKQGDPLSIKVMNTFCAMLGTAAANLVLNLGARGGLYVGGGIVPRLGEFFDQSPFRQRFEERGRFSEYLAQIPSFVITAKTPALIGAAEALRQVQS